MSLYFSSNCIAFALIFFCLVMLVYRFLFLLSLGDFTNRDSNFKKWYISLSCWWSHSLLFVILNWGTGCIKTSKDKLHSLCCCELLLSIEVWEKLSQHLEEFVITWFDSGLPWTKDLLDRDWEKLLTSFSRTFLDKFTWMFFLKLREFAHLLFLFSLFFSTFDSSS